MTKGGPLLTPNQITVSRFVLIFPFFVGWFITEEIFLRCLICVGFIAIFVADAWDGLVARTYNMSSVFGVYFDPIVDHISYFALCIMLIESDHLATWFLFVFIVRDFLVLFVKQYAAAQNVVISASYIAKAKADLISVPLACIYPISVVAEPYGLLIIAAIAAYLIGFKYIFKASREHTLTIRVSLAILAIIFLLKPADISLAQFYETVYIGLALLTSVGSGAHYFVNSRALFLKNEKSVGELDG